VPDLEASGHACALATRCHSGREHRRHRSDPGTTLPLPSGDLSSFQGRSLVGLLEQKPDGAPRGRYSESLYPRSTFWLALPTRHRDDEYHYIDAPRAELYDLKLDPNETRNLIDEKPAVAAALRQTVRRNLGTVQNARRKASARSWT